MAKKTHVIKRGTLSGTIGKFLKMLAAVLVAMVPVVKLMVLIVVELHKVYTLSGGVI